MPKGKRPENGRKKQNAGTIRASISFPRDIYLMLEELAKEKKVSLAWVMRDAAEKYLTGKAAPPLS